MLEVERASLFPPKSLCYSLNCSKLTSSSMEGLFNGTRYSQSICWALSARPLWSLLCCCKKSSTFLRPAQLFHMESCLQQGQWNTDQGLAIENAGSSPSWPNTGFADTPCQNWSCFRGTGQCWEQKWPCKSRGCWMGVGLTASAFKVTAHNCSLPRVPRKDATISLFWRSALGLGKGAGRVSNLTCMTELWIPKETLTQTNTGRRNA